MSNKAYEKVTQKIIERLEAGVVPWRMPWTSAGPARSLNTGHEYRGFNRLVLNCAGYASPNWVTYKQAQARGFQVRKGEQGWPCIYWNDRYQRKNKDTGETEEVRYDGFFLRYYTVFNLAQCDGVPADMLAIPDRNADRDPDQACQRIIAAMPSLPQIADNGKRCFYSPVSDSITMAPRQSFESNAAYYHTLFHELGHATGHKSRTNRHASKGYEHDGFGGQNYSREELVAEITACFLADHAGIDTPELGDQSAAYIASWLKALREDSKLIVSAAGKAQTASDFILGRKAETKRIAA